MTEIIHRLILLQKEYTLGKSQHNCLIVSGRRVSHSNSVPSVHIEEDSVQIELNPNFESIHTLFQELKHVHHVKLIQFTKLVFVDHDFTHLPTNLASVLPNIKELTITSCKHYNNMDSSVDQFLCLRHINFVKCPELKSLSSLANISERCKLRHFVFDMCGLEVQPYDTWSEGLCALGKLRINPKTDCVSITIGSCDQLKSLPSSIGYLKNIPLRLDITFNNCLRRLPHALGDLIYLKSLICRVSKHISKDSLPWSMGRLHPNVLVWLPKKEGIMTIRDLEAHFSQSRRKFFYGFVMLKIALDRFHIRLQQRHHHRNEEQDECCSENKDEMESLRLMVDDIRIECIL
jgi:hypothetical protein